MRGGGGERERDVQAGVEVYVQRVRVEVELDGRSADIGTHLHTFGGDTSCSYWCDCCGVFDDYFAACFCLIVANFTKNKPPAVIIFCPKN